MDAVNDIDATGTEATRTTAPERVRDTVSLAQQGPQLPGGRSLPSLSPSFIVFFDGVCVLCHTGMRQLMALDTDGKLHYAQLQGETAKSFGIHWDDDASPGSQTFVFIDNSGPEPIIYRRMRAVRAELEVIDRLPVLTFLLKVIPLPITNLLYKAIAATRYRLWGTYDACPLPPERVRSRFLP